MRVGLDQECLFVSNSKVNGQFGRGDSTISGGSGGGWRRSWGNCNDR